MSSPFYLFSHGGSHIHVTQVASHMLNVWSFTQWFMTSNYFLRQESEVLCIMGLKAVFEEVEVKKTMPTAITKEGCSSSTAKHNMDISKVHFNRPHEMELT